MDPRIQIRIRTKMSWIRNTTFLLHVPVLCAYTHVKAPLLSGMSHSCRFRSLADPLPHPMLRAALTLAKCLPGKLMKKPFGYATALPATSMLQFLYRYVTSRT
jgi:hypothetical protein